MVKPRARHHSAPTRPSHQGPRAQRKGKKVAKIFDNPLIAQNWDRKRTLSQNYARLGLTARLGKARGGIEHAARQAVRRKENDAKSASVGVEEVEVLRDEKGNIVGIVQKGKDASPRHDDGMIEEGGVKRRKTAAEMRYTTLNPLATQQSVEEDSAQEATALNPHAPMGFLGADALEAAGATNDEDQEALIGQLARQALFAQKQHGSRVKRRQSQRERLWCRDLVARHGQDYSAMARDTRLNIMQQSAGDIKRRVQLFMGKSMP